MKRLKAGSIAVLLATSVFLPAVWIPAALASTAPARVRAALVCGQNACIDGAAPAGTTHTVTLTPATDNSQPAPSNSPHIVTLAPAADNPQTAESDASPAPQGVDVDMDSSPTLSDSQVAALLALLQQESSPSPSPSPAIKRVAGKTVTSARGAATGTTVTASASCDTGHVLFGGGGLVTTSDGKNLDKGVLAQSSAVSDTTWMVAGIVANGPLGETETLNVTPLAICSA